MLHPGEKNLHDWAEVYFEGVGWVPVDVSFGRYTPSSNPDIVGFYSHGMDAHRLAANHTVCGDFYPAWNSHLQLISVTPVETKQ